MVDEDATCRAMLREIRTTLRDVAAVLPMPVLFEQHADRTIPVVDRLSDAWATVKNAVASLFGRGPGSGTALEQAGTAGGAALGGGAAAKLVTACLVAGGGAAICAETGLFSGNADPPPLAERAEREAAAAPTPQPSRARLVPTQRREPSKSRPPQRRRSTRPATSSPAARPDPSPAPAGSTEFGAGTIGSAAPRRGPLRLPQRVGGSSAREAT